MPMVSPTLNLPTPSTSSSASAKPAGLMPPPTLPAAPSMPTLPSPPSTTVSLSPQAMSLASSHASSPSPSNSTSGASAPTPAAVAQDGSIYDSLKHGIASAIADVGDAIAGGAHAIVSGVETALSTANDVAVGIVELPFAAVAKTADAAGALIDEL